MCKNSGIIKVLQKQNNIVLYFDAEKCTLDMAELVHKYNNQIKFSTRCNTIYNLQSTRPEKCNIGNRGDFEK